MSSARASCGTSRRGSGDASKTAARCTSVARFAAEKNRHRLRRRRERRRERTRRRFSRDRLVPVDARGRQRVRVQRRARRRRGPALRGAQRLERRGGNFLDPGAGRTRRGGAGEPEKTPNPFARMRVGPAALTAEISVRRRGGAPAGADGQVSVLDVRRVATGDVFSSTGSRATSGASTRSPRAEGPRDDDDDDDDDDDGDDGASETTPNALLGRFRADVCADPPATPRFLLAGGEADVVEVWDRPRRALAARARATPAGSRAWPRRLASRLGVGARKKIRATARRRRRLRCFAPTTTRWGSTTERKPRTRTIGTTICSPTRARRDVCGSRARGRIAGCAFGELDVDPAPKWWVPVFDKTPDPERHVGEGFTTSANDVPAGRAGTATREAESEGVLSHENLSGAGDANDANDEAPPSVPPRAPRARVE